MTKEMHVRNAEPNDLPAVMVAEQHWPADQRAERRKIEIRLERFPAGFFVCELDGEIVGISTSCPVRYEPGDLSNFQSWKHACNGGYLHPEHEVQGANGLYIVSTGVITPRRGEGVLEGLIGAQLRRARELGYAYGLTGATIPGYDDYCRRHGETAAAHYALSRKNGRPIDGFLHKLEALGLVLPDARHVIADYYPSPESRNYGALLVHRTGALVHARLDPKTRRLPGSDSPR